MHGHCWATSLTQGHDHHDVFPVCGRVLSDQSPWSIHWFGSNSFGFNSLLVWHLMSLIVMRSDSRQRRWLTPTAVEPRGDAWHRPVGHCEGRVDHAEWPDLSCGRGEGSEGRICLQSQHGRSVTRPRCVGACHDSGLTMSPRRGSTTGGSDSDPFRMRVTSRSTSEYVCAVRNSSTMSSSAISNDGRLKA